MTVQGIANTAWAFATAGQLDAALCAELARVAGRRVCQFKAQDFGNTAWAFATASELDCAVFAPFARAVEWLVGEFKP